MNRLRLFFATLAASTAVLLVGCASNPLMTGEPKDWVGHTADELRTGLGAPDRVVPQADGSEVWEYIAEGTYVRENRSPGTYQNVNRYRVKNGVIKDWYFERSEDGRVVSRDH